jgi:hypothetical protein
MANAPTHRIIIRPLPDLTGNDPQGWHRLRACLKAMLRSYRIQVCTFETVTQDDIAAADEAVATGTEVVV